MTWTEAWPTLLHREHCGGEKKRKAAFVVWRSCPGTPG
jgi:hypothetical protein